MTKEKMICGYCKREIENIKDIKKRSNFGTVVLMCPHCNVVLGIKKA